MQVSKNKLNNKEFVDTEYGILIQQNTTNNRTKPTPEKHNFEKSQKKKKPCMWEKRSLKKKYLLYVHLYDILGEP